MGEAARGISTAFSWRAWARKEYGSESGTRHLCANEFRVTRRNHRQRISGTRDTRRLAVITSFAVFAALAPSDKTFIVPAEAAASAVKPSVGNLTGENLNSLLIFPPIPSRLLCREERISSFSDKLFFVSWLV